jgi:hypothetical protein
VSAGEIREVIEELPNEIRMLWPEPQAGPQAFSDLSPR